MTDGARNLQVRIAAPSDAEAMARLHHKSHIESFAPFVPAEWVATRDIDAYRHRWARTLTRLDSRNRAWVVELDDEIVGIVQVYELEGATAELASMHVMPGLMGKGIGALLMEEAIRFIRDAGYASGRLGVAAGNERAWRFYERFGWKRGHYQDVGVEGVPVFHYCLDVNESEA